MPISRILFLCVFFLLFAALACAAGEDPVIAKTSDYVFRQSDLDRLLSYSPDYLKEQLKKDPRQKTALVRKIMQQRIIAEIAKKQKFDQEKAVKEQLGYMTEDFLANAYLYQVVMKKVTVTENDMKGYYEENIKEFTEPEQVKVRHILIKVPFGASEDQKKKAREKAENILEWLKKGEKFDVLARTYSEDPGSKDKGGDLGYISRGRTAKSFEEAAFSMKPGEISSVIESDFGFHVIQVEDRREAKTRTFDESKDFIKQKLTENMTKAKVEEFIKKSGEEAGLEIYEEKLSGGEKKK